MTFVRVQNENGSQSSVSAVYAEAQGLKVIEDAQATTPGGKPLPATYPEAKPVSEMKKDELQAELDRRNAGRIEAEQITIDGDVTVASLRAALDADTAANLA